MHLHSAQDEGRLSVGLAVPPGTQTEVAAVAVGAKSAEYPFTNCSRWAAVDRAVCRDRCLRRARAIECCKVAPPRPSLTRVALGAVVFAPGTAEMGWVATGWVVAG